MSQLVSDIPREKLKALVNRNGEDLLQDPDRCEGLLKDHCSSFRREISALVGALEERIPLELKSSWQAAMTPEAMRARLVQRLEENRGLAPDVANWAVDAWSYALGVGLGRQSERTAIPADPAAGFSSGPARPAESGFANAAATTWGPAVPGPVSVADRVASDRVASDPITVAAVQDTMQPTTARPVAKKAGMGAVGLLAIGAAAWAFMHKPDPVPAPAPTPAPVPGNTGGGSGQVRPAPPPPRPSPPAPDAQRPDPRPQNPKPRQSPAPVIAASPDLRHAQDRMIEVQARADAAVSGVDSIRRQQQAAGYDMRGDILAAMNRMRSYLTEANRAIAQRNAQLAASYMDKAEVDLATLEKFLGR